MTNGSSGTAGCQSTALIPSILPAHQPAHLLSCPRFISERAFGSSLARQPEVGPSGPPACRRSAHRPLSMSIRACSRVASSLAALAGFVLADRTAGTSTQGRSATAHLCVCRHTFVLYGGVHNMDTWTRLRELGGVLSSAGSVSGSAACGELLEGLDIMQAGECWPHVRRLFPRVRPSRRRRFESIDIDPGPVARVGACLGLMYVHSFSELDRNHCKSRVYTLAL